jgi:hypothetical protein
MEKKERRKERKGRKEGRNIVVYSVSKMYLKGPDFALYHKKFC